MRKSLNRKGLEKVRIIANDMYDGAKWKPYVKAWALADTFLNDREFKKSVYALGYHYTNSKTTQNARNLGLPLWNSESWSMAGNWKGALELAKILVKDYVEGRITKTMMWCIIDSYYDNVNHAGKGLMKADSPWSGHYEVLSAIWSVAHFTQFSKPGWKYIDSGCGTSAGKSTFITLKKPDHSGNYSLIIVTDTIPETLKFRITGLLTKPLHVWKSNESQQFFRRTDIVPRSDNTFVIDAEANTIYSLTTITGPQKGTTGNLIPGDVPFPDEYTENFEKYHLSQSPKYLGDQAGAFEVVKFPGETQTMRQVITGPLIPWYPWGPNNPEPYTGYGLNLGDYEVSSDVLIEKSGTVKIAGRVSWFESNTGPHGYILSANEKGQWQLFNYKKILASGSVPFKADSWHNLKLQMIGPSIKAFIDGHEIGSVTDKSNSSGPCGFGTGWNHARFDNVKVKPLHP